MARASTKMRGSHVNFDICNRMVSLQKMLFELHLLLKVKKIKILTSMTRTELAQNMCVILFRFSHSPLNDVISKIILGDLDLLF